MEQDGAMAIGLEVPGRHDATMQHAHGHVQVSTGQRTSHKPGPRDLHPNVVLHRLVVHKLDAGLGQGHWQRQCLTDVPAAQGCQQ